LADETGVRRLEGGFPVEREVRPLSEALRHLADLHRGYLIRHQKPDGTFYLRYEPFQNRLYEGDSLPWLAHAAWVLARSHKILGDRKADAAAGKAVRSLLRAAVAGKDGIWLQGPETSTIAELSFLLLALCERNSGARSGEAARTARQIADTLWSAIDSHGRIATHRPPADCPNSYQDYFPGQALLALGAAVGAGYSRLGKHRLDRLRAAFRYYRHRFRYRRNFGQVSWLMQAFAAWWKVTGDRAFSDLVFEVGDWVVDYQLEKTGAFINDHQPDTPGYTTALYLEGIAAALELAGSFGDRERYEKYVTTCSRAYEFIDRLVIQKRDYAVLPNPELAIGGLRQSIHRSEIRIDFVQHSLSSVLSLYPILVHDDLGKAVQWAVNRRRSPGKKRTRNR
jgi:hypothetical protein